jgi:plasmid stabilization system protein ParE
MAKKIIWTAEAEKTHDAVIDYLEEHWSEREVRRYIERVGEVIERIKKHPLLSSTIHRERRM